MHCHLIKEHQHGHEARRVDYTIPRVTWPAHRSLETSRSRSMRRRALMMHVSAAPGLLAEPRIHVRAGALRPRATTRRNSSTAAGRLPAAPGRRSRVTGVLPSTAPVASPAACTSSHCESEARELSSLAPKTGGDVQLSCLAGPSRSVVGAATRSGSEAGDQPLRPRRATSLAPVQRPVTISTALQVRVAPPLVVLHVSEPVPLTPLYAPVPPVQVIALLYVASLLLVNWNVWL